MSTAVIAVEGVLSAQPYFSVNMLPSDDGIALYRALAGVFRVVLSSDHPDAEKVSHWLISQWIRPEQYGHLLTGDRAGHLRSLRASRTAISLVVDAEPEVVAYAASTGLSGLLFVPPRPAAHRRDLAVRSIRDWSSIENESHREFRA